MSEETKQVIEEPVVEETVVEEPVMEEPVVEEESKDEPLQIQVDGKTAYSMKLLEYDKNIAEAEAAVANLKKEKVAFIYDTQVQGIAEQYKQAMLRKQVEEETLKRAQTNSQ